MRIDGFIQKPVDVESLIRAIQAVMTAGPARDG
jgi:DNA-binding NarL/FixJ family response regulator